MQRSFFFWEGRGLPSTLVSRRGLEKTPVFLYRPKATFNNFRFNQIYCFLSVRGELTQCLPPLRCHFFIFNMLLFLFFNLMTHIFLPVKLLVIQGFPLPQVPDPGVMGNAVGGSMHWRPTQRLSSGS